MASTLTVGLILAACSASDGAVGVVESELVLGSTTTTTTTTTTTSAATTIPPTSVVETTVPTETVPGETVGDEARSEPSVGVGDELFPELGSLDVDVLSYDVALTVMDGVDDGTIQATVGIEATVDPSVSVLALDAVDLDIAAVTIDGVEADFTTADNELLVDLPVARDLTVSASIDYRFTPQNRRSDVGLPVGWLPSDGRSYVLNEPDGGRTWLPSNDHPSDKASWTFQLTVPDDRIAAANGELVQEGGAGEAWIWRQDEPMSTYLVQVIVGDYDIIESEPVVGAAGTPIPITNVVPAGRGDDFADAIATIEEQILFFEERFGPYPLDRYGLAFVDDLSGLAMETQGRSMLGADDFEDRRLGYFQQLLLAHELAHQWFGNAVSPDVWSDLWLNESFASYAQWLWLDSIDLQPLDSYSQQMLLQRQRSADATGDPGLTNLFGFERYDGGAVVVHALRLTMGDDAFFEMLSTWVADNDGTARGTDDFIALAEEAHGSDLTEFFDDWLYAEGLPDAYPT